jgi:hypothetical protein
MNQNSRSDPIDPLQSLASLANDIQSIKPTDYNVAPEKADDAQFKSAVEQYCLLCNANMLQPADKQAAYGSLFDSIVMYIKQQHAIGNVQQWELPVNFPKQPEMNFNQDMLEIEQALRDIGPGAYRSEQFIAEKKAGFLNSVAPPAPDPDVSPAPKSTQHTEKKSNISFPPNTTAPNPPVIPLSSIPPLSTIVATCYKKLCSSRSSEYSSKQDHKSQP